MTLSNLDQKKLYYYVICVMAFFVLMWGVIDLTSASLGLINLRGADTTLSGPATDLPIVSEKGDQFFDVFYQKKMLQDRLWDSLARVVISGLIFGYCRFTLNKLEAAA